MKSTPFLLPSLSEPTENLHQTLVSPDPHFGLICQLLHLFSAFQPRFCALVTILQDLNGYLILNIPFCACTMHWSVGLG